MTWELSYRFIWDYCVACKLLWNIIWSINSLFTNNLKYFIGEENVVRLPKCSWFRFSLSFSSTIMDSFGTFHFHLPHFTSALSRALVRIWFPFICSLSVSLSMISSSVSLSVVQSSVSLSMISSYALLGMYSSSSLSLSFCSSSLLSAGIGNCVNVLFLL